MIQTTFKLKDFDGPLDLLLVLVGKAQINIRDIFVSEITEQYLEIVREAQDMNMDEASDFLVMAATLMEIKSRAMLPKPPPPEEGEEDPEEALIRRLEEYKRFRETAEEMKEFEEAARKLFTKLPEEFPLPAQEIEITGLDLDGLMAAMLRILARKPAENEISETNRYTLRNIHRDSHTVQECMLKMLKVIRLKRVMRFEEAFSDAPTKEEVVTFFLALLELLKLGQMHLRQKETYGTIELIAGRADIPENVPEEEPEIGRRRRRRKEESPGAAGGSGGEHSGAD